MKNFKPQAWMLPQCVLVIGTYGENGLPNAMNAAWAGQWDATQIMISLGAHATTENLKRCNEFTVAFATKSTMVGADYVGIVSGAKVPDKVARTGWKHIKAPNVEAPLFTDFPLTLECRVSQKFDESETGCYLVADIVNIVCDDKYVGTDGKPDVEKMELITYEPVHHGYLLLGQRVGNAFADGKKLKD